MKDRIISLVNDVAEYYNARASEYDFSAGYDDPVSELLRIPIRTRYLPLFTGCKVLEIACGTGYWTKVISETAKSIVATDINSSKISIAQSKLSDVKNVDFEIADAYSLDGVSGDFNAAYAFWWWSHIPKTRLTEFIKVLHSKLLPNAFVLFVDQLPSAYNGMNRHFDQDNNLLEDRILKGGGRFTIVKNFPSEI